MIGLWLKYGDRGSRHDILNHYSSDGSSQSKTLPLPGQKPASFMFSHSDANWYVSLFKGHNSTRDNLEFQWPSKGSF